MPPYTMAFSRVSNQRKSVSDAAEGSSAPSIAAGHKISIRGKGSVKEGKGRPGGGFDDDENDELHCLIMAETEEKVQRCVKLINSVIEIVRNPFFDSF